MSKLPRTVLGVKCQGCGPSTIRCLKEVLCRVRERRPVDFRRLEDKVLGVKVVTFEAGTLGEWRGQKPIDTPEVICAKVQLQGAQEGWGRDRIVEERGRVCMKLQDRHEWPGDVLLSPALEQEPDFDIRAVIAHELGHAAARAADIEKRDEACCGLDVGEEWITESVADMYAFKWGFARDVRRHASGRNPLHHPPLPGGRLVLYDSDTGEDIKLVMTRAFYLRRRN